MDEKTAAEFLQTQAAEKQQAVADEFNQFIGRMAREYGYVPSPMTITGAAGTRLSWEIIPRQAQAENKEE